VENKMASLIHRPIQVTVHKVCGKTHLSVHYSCGLTACGTTKFTFLDDLTDDHLLCERCELKHTEKGFPSSSEICGHHVHIGKTKAVKICC
jgi:hypothetical protein